MAINNAGYDVVVKLWGELACFTRPEFKVERVSYPVITPSAARGALEAIFWKPEIRWEIREIWVLNPIKEIAVMRNEIKDRQSPAVRNSYYIEDRRQQRTSLFIKNPAYLVFADVRLKENTIFPKRKYIEQFNRRLERGECYHQPYLGTRECSAYFSEPGIKEDVANESRTIGNMLFEIAYRRSSTRKDFTFMSHDDDQTQEVPGFAQPIFFTAKLENGVMKLPMSKYEELYRLEGVHVKGIG